MTVKETVSPRGTLTLAGWTLTLALTFAVALPAPAQQPDGKPAQDPQVAEIEKQIAELQKKLAELKEAEKLAAGATLPESYVKQLNWRSIGPACMGGRITALSVYEADPTTYWVATASGGLLKTVNNGVTFEHQFDKEATVSVGAVCVAPSNREIVWVGTGENNPRNSVSYGDGVYKSTDGGKTWKNMGLKKSFQIGKIAIHPTNPNIVYVGALGRLYGPNEERGLFKTVDGGVTWEKILYFDDKTGVIDLLMHPERPDELLVAMWERRRDGFDAFIGTPRQPEGYDGYDPDVKWGPHAGIYKTTDGKTFKKLAKGLPTCKYGRVGLTCQAKKPNTVFAIIDCEKIGKTSVVAAPAKAELGAIAQSSDAGLKLMIVNKDGAAEKAGLKEGDILLAVDGKKFEKGPELAAYVAERKPTDKLKVEYKRGSETKTAEVAFAAPAAAPAAAPPAGPRGDFGAFGRGDDEGLRLTSVAEGRAAAKAGFKEDDLILTFDGKKVENSRELNAAAGEKKPGDKVKVTYKRGSETKTVEVALGERPQGEGGGPGGGGMTPSAPGSDFSARPFSGNYGGQRENVQDRQGKDGHEFGGVYKSTDFGETWTRVNSFNPRPMYFSLVRVDPEDDKYVYVGGINMTKSEDGGKTMRGDAKTSREVHSDHHALWINPKDGRHMLIGTDGGLYVTYDRMQNWDHLNTMAMGQFYHVCVDNQKPYYVYGGLQDNGSWGAPSMNLKGGGMFGRGGVGNGPVNEDWLYLNGGDGFVCRAESDGSWVYAESQGGMMVRRNLKTGEQGFIRPNRNTSGVNSTRWNWNTPFLLSSHNQRVFYCAGEYVFRCMDRGAALKAISPEITLTKRGSATALAESPRNPDILWVGTDDGALHVTKDGGKTWTKVNDKVGLPGPRWVSTIEASRFAEGRAYVCFDAHRSDDDKPYVYVTEDFGATWKPIVGNLPWGSTRCLREDTENQDLLYCGTEFAVFVSLNRGRTWMKINNNLPTVAVHEIAVHPTAGEIVAATHGRSLWILDVAALRQMKPATLNTDVALFKPNNVIRWRNEAGRGGTNRAFAGSNPAPGAHVYYSLCKKPEKISLKVVDVEGKTVRELTPTSEVGLNRVTWNLARANAQRPGGGGPGGGGGRRGGFTGFLANPGEYGIVLTVDGKTFTTSVRVDPDPTLPMTYYTEGGPGESEMPWPDPREREEDEDDEDKD